MAEDVSYWGHCPRCGLPSSLMTSAGCTSCGWPNAQARVAPVETSQSASGVTAVQYIHTVCGDCAAKDAEIARLTRELEAARRERDAALHREGEQRWVAQVDHDGLKEAIAERAKRCGTCADAVIHNLVTKVYGCRSKTSACAGPKCDWREWPADHGCPCWRQREAPHA